MALCFRTAPCGEPHVRVCVCVCARVCAGGITGPLPVCHGCASHAPATCCHGLLPHCGYVESRAARARAHCKMVAFLWPGKPRPTVVCAWPLASRMRCCRCPPPPAAKYEEPEERVPSASTINKYANDVYQQKLVHQMEVLVLTRYGLIPPPLRAACVLYTLDVPVAHAHRVHRAAGSIGT